MARGRNREGASISLLPILSIQKCTMGVMVVIICAQNLVSIGKSSEQAKDQYLEIAGTVKDREAVFVECQEKGVVLHPAGAEVALDALKGAGPSSFHRLLDELEASAGKKYLVLLVRPEGIDAYERASLMARRRKLDFGKDALLTGGKIVLTQDGKPLVEMKKAVP